MDTEILNNNHSQELKGLNCYHLQQDLQTIRQDASRLVHQTDSQSVKTLCGQSFTKASLHFVIQNSKIWEEVVLGRCLKASFGNVTCKDANS